MHEHGNVACRRALEDRSDHSRRSRPVRAPAGSEIPTQPRSSSRSTWSGSAPSRATGPQAANSPGSESTPSRCASINSRARRRGSASIPIGLEIATSARSSPSRRTTAARCSGASVASSITYGGSAAVCSTIRPLVRRICGGDCLAAKRSSSGAVQTCWCTSTRISADRCTDASADICALVADGVGDHADPHQQTEDFASEAIAEDRFEGCGDR